MTFPVVIYSRKDFYLLDSLNEKIEELKAAGLMDYWHFKAVDGRFLKLDAFQDPAVLKLRSFLGCFQVLSCGFIASLLVFMAEKMIVRFEKRA